MSQTDPANLLDAWPLRWNDAGLIPAIVQDARTGEVLMMAWMDRSALERTVATKQTHFYSRSRKSAWHKGETSGHVQHLESLRIDCDGDVVLLGVRQIGGACHEGYRSCFFRELGADRAFKVTGERVFNPDEVYREQA